MILVDANLLIYAHAADLPEHASAHEWLDRTLSGRTRVGLPWPSLLAFVRIVSNPRVFERPEPVAAAWEQIESWLAAPAAWIPVAGDAHRTLLAGLMPFVSTPALVPDAHLAALAIEHGLTLQTTDRDFARFDGLRWANPLS